MLGFPVNIKDDDGRSLAISGIFGVTMFWTTAAISLGEATAPAWARMAMDKFVWSHTSLSVWIILGPALTAAMSIWCLAIIWANYRRRKGLSVFLFIAAHGLVILAVFVKAGLLYANKA